MAIESKFINPYTDYGFKRLFGTEANKDLLIDFLNQFLPEKHQVADLFYAPNEHLGVNEMDRKAVFDVYCVSQTGDRFIVELQKARQTYFKDRSIFYASFPVQEQALKGDWDFKLAAIYTVAILNFVLTEHEETPDVVSVVQLKDQHGRVFYDKLTFIYMEMPKFTKSVDQLETHADKWQYVFNNLETLQERPPAIGGSIFERLFNAAEVAKFSKADRESYERSLKSYRDLKNTMEAAAMQGIEDGIKQGYQQGVEEGIQKGIKKGIEEGIQQGMQQGIQQGMQQGIEEGIQQGMQQGEYQAALRIAKRALAQGKSVDEVIELTGLSKTSINALVDEQPL